MAQEVYNNETRRDRSDQGSRKIKARRVKAEKMRTDSKERGKAKKSFFIVLTFISSGARDGVVNESKES